ncbi:uncharacterized protein LOC143917177 isoform X3 [Arctopsyche grandis]|uniref:uncharacterized protein LOC143917177 isoform X3 n=1 Tax=Arctopsyche grandis TaxID=121162 RepID=UPI00406D874C
MDEIGVPVDLYIYDLTKGMARLMSAMFLGHQVDGIWHTSVVAYGREYFFGGEGIQSCNPAGTILGQPQKIEKLGDTFIPYQIFLDYIVGLGDTNFRGCDYNLFKHNCNNFTDELANFLCGVGIPKYILDLPEEVLNTPLGQSLRPLIESLGTGAQNIVSANGIRNNRQESPDYLQLNTQIEEARLQSLALEEKRNSINEKLARKERKKEKKRKKQQKEQDKLNNSSSECSDLSNTGFPPITSNSKPTMAEAAAAELNGNSSIENFEEEEESTPGPARSRSDKLPSDRVLEMEAEERHEDEERKKHREPPIVFKDFMEVTDAFAKLNEALKSASLDPAEQINLEELRVYLVEGEGSWALGDNFLNFIGRLLGDASLPSSTREAVLNTLTCAALRDDVILLLHQDRREHILMNFAFSIDRMELNEQRALSMFVCNMFEHLSPSEWLLYISEWPHTNQQISNIRVTTKVAVHSLLSEDEKLKDIGSAIVHNLACKEVKTVVFDDVAVELAMAILQHLSSAPAEEHLYRCLKALFKFCQVSGQDVPQLIQMIGPNPATFKGTSPRVDELIDSISRKLR